MKTARTWASQLGAVGQLFHHPERALGAIREGCFWVPFLLVCVLGMLAQWATIPYIDRVSRTMSDQPPGLEAQGIVRLVLLFALALHPLMLLLRWVLFAGLLALALGAAGGRLSFRRCFSLAAFASVYAVFEPLQTLLVLWWRGISAVESVADLTPPIGLDLLWPLSGALGALLRQINAPQLAAAVFLCFGAGRLTLGLSARRTAFIAAALTLALMAAKAAAFGGA